MAKTLRILFLFFVALFTSSCSDDEPKDQVKEITMFVSPETDEMYGFWTELPYECMLVKFGNPDGEWEKLGLYDIEGFTYERGHEYELRVKRTILADPPADGSGRTYSLVRVVKDNKVKEPTPLPVDASIKSEKDIEYQESCPINYKVAHNYIVNDNGDIFYSDASNSHSYKSLRIDLEETLEYTDPNWDRNQYLSYATCFSYVISPLSDKIKMVRNDYAGPLFRDVIPEAEFEHITQEMKSGDELQYQLVLLNVDKKGLQKVQFTITKR